MALGENGPIGNIVTFHVEMDSKSESGSVITQSQHMEENLVQDGMKERMKISSPTAIQIHVQVRGREFMESVVKSHMVSLSFFLFVS